MAASKSLILKGISGFAATCLAAAGGFEVKNLFQSSSANSSSLEKNDEDEFEGESKEDDDLGVPSSCFISKCDLTAKQLRKLKFERRSDSSISVGGLSDNDTFELTVEEVSGDTENYPKGKKYILKAKETTGTVTIEGVKGGDVVLEVGGEGVDLREKESGGGLEKVPEGLNNLGIPKRCEGEQTCELTKEQLQRLKFETKNVGGSIRVNGLAEKNTVTLTVTVVSEDKDNYPHSKKYTLTSTSGTVTIKGVKDGDIVLEKNKGVNFRETSEGSKLETVENSLGIPRRCETSTESSCQLTKDELQKLKFETEDESSITVEELTDNETVELTIENKEDDLINYPKGKKYTLKASEGNVKIKGIKGGDIELEAGEEGVVIRETTKGGKLEKAPEEVDSLGIPKSCNVDKAVGETTQTCELTAEQLKRFKFEPKGNETILVEGLSGDATVTLEIEDKKEDKTNFPRGKKYSITSSKEKVTIKNVKEGDIVLEAKGNVVIRETVKGGKLEKIPEEVDKLGIPTRCNKPCKLTKEQLLRLRFEQKTSTPIKIEGLEGEKTVDLTVTDALSDQTNYPKGKKYTLKSTSGKVTIKGVKGGDIDIEDKGVVVREKQSGGLLERAPEEVDELGIPTSCTTGSTCKLTKDQLKKIKFDPKGKTSIWISGMGVKDKVDLKVEESSYTNYYPKGKMYTFTSDKDNVTIKGVKEGDIVLDKDKDVLIRETGGGGGKLETSLNVLGIPKGCKAEEVKKRPNIQTCELTADQLKHLKLKAFEGKAGRASVTGLSGENKITLKISWDEDGSTYQDNKRYSFDNTSRNEEIRITKSGQTVTLEKKKESWFKNEGGKLVLVEANTKSQVKMKDTNVTLKKLGLLEKLELKSSDFNGDSNSTWHKQKIFNNLTESDLKKIPFKTLGGKVKTVVDGLSSKYIKVSFDWDGTSKFPNNMKFTFANTQINPNVQLKGANNQSIWLKKVSNLGDSKHKYKVENDLLVEAS